MCLPRWRWHWRTPVPSSLDYRQAASVPWYLYDRLSTCAIRTGDATPGAAFGVRFWRRERLPESGASCFLPPPTMLRLSNGYRRPPRVFPIHVVRTARYTQRLLQRPSTASTEPWRWCRSDRPPKLTAELTRAFRVAARRAFLNEHPICSTCRQQVATVLDHIRPHRGIGWLFWGIERTGKGCVSAVTAVKTASETLASRWLLGNIKGTTRFCSEAPPRRPTRLLGSSVASSLLASAVAVVGCELSMRGGRRRSLGVRLYGSRLQGKG